MKRILLSASLFILSLTAFSQIVSEPFHTAKDTTNSVVYLLPKNLIGIQVETLCRQETPGIYFQYAERFLGIKDFIQNESTRYEIKGIRLRTKTTADTTKTYLISAGKKTKNFSIALTPEGFLKSINGPQETIAEKPKQIGPKDRTNKTMPEWQTQPDAVFTKEMQLASSTAKMAEIAANQLFTIRENRFNLLGQEADKTPGDGRSYEIVLSELNRMEKAYLELFKGTTTERTRTFSYTLDPKGNSNDILFRFSLLKGILDKNDLGGNPFYLQIQALPQTPAAFRKDKSATPQALYYRLPAKALISITDGKEVLFSQEVELPQLGAVQSVPSSQLGSAELDTANGMLLRLVK